MARIQPNSRPIQNATQTSRLSAAVHALRSAAAVHPIGRSPRVRAIRPEQIPDRISRVRRWWPSRRCGQSSRAAVRPEELTETPQGRPQAVRNRVTRAHGRRSYRAVLRQALQAANRGRFVKLFKPRIEESSSSSCGKTQRPSD